MKKFITRLTLISMALAVLSVLVFSGLGPENQTMAWPYLLVFFLASNSFLFYLFNRYKSGKTSSFTNFFMLATFLKLIVYLAVIVVYLLYNKKEAAPFIITFFVYYVVYTAYEVAAVTRFMHKS
ncbi:MAG: hypothetical protein KKD74_02930 [Bacteroidetes bacterium]|nr:hypothetical protein [Bacteroidales bacterium]MBU1009069.1 hypothetical protein [Bacteroidota bacterium]